MTCDVQIPLNLLVVAIGWLSFLAGRWYESNERRNEDHGDREVEAE